MDFAKGRVYLPQEDMERFGVSDETIAEGVATPEFRALMRYEVDFARGLFEAGTAADRHGEPRSGAGSGPVQPRRPGDSARHRAAGLRCAERAAGHLESAPKLALALRAVTAKCCRFCDSPRGAEKSA